MPDVESAASGGSGNNSSDFVRKLYKMLEEPQYANVVRWGNDGTSFVVLENEKFTKSILPKHFKHSNFASFVRQLNKYDFHKVRHNDDGGQSPYGPDAWEFIHPEFRADRKDNLDNIRRKAPAPRKTQVAEDTYAQTQGQVDVLQQTVQQLSVELTNMRNESYNTIRVLTEEVGRLRKVVTAQSHAIFDLVGFEVEEVARKKREQDEQEGLPPTHSLPVIRTDELPSLLRQARDSSTNVFEDLGESSNELIELAAKYGNDKDKLFDLGPPRNGMGGDPLDDNRFIFPGGMSNGINGRGGFNGEGEAGKIKRKNIWGKRQPIILLVDDNGVHAKYAQRALQRLNCRYDYARNGQEAVRKVNADPGKFDLILMDIIMPYLGGVEATAALRTENYPRMPIIALTTSWKPADVAMYLKHGMDDILAKPYTEDVLEAMLRKYLPKLVRHVKIEDLVSSHDALPTVPAYPKPVPPKPTGTLVINTSLNNSATAAARMDQTPIQSPSTTISWHSPANQLTAVTHGASPTINPGVVNPMVRTTQANGMVSITNGVTNGLNGLGGNMPNDMSGSPITSGLSAGGLSGSPLSNASMTNGVMASIEMPMGHVGPPNYAMMNGMGIPGMPVTQRPPFPGMNSGYNHLTVDSGVDFGDERPEKRQRLYAPGEIGGY